MNSTTVNIENIIENNMMEFSAYTLLHRALPDLRDGLKPVHRRILWAMNQMKATKLTKSANVEGEVFKYHPHGSTYPTIVTMVQTERQFNPLLVGKGNFGSYTSRDLAPAASRYSEVKLSDVAIEMMKNLDKNIVNFVDNYDGTKKIPEVLPVKFPAILAYSNTGIGVGFSSAIPSFNLKELCEAIIKYIETGEKTILVPDFPTGGSIIKDDNALHKINSEGTGTIKIRGKAEIVGNEILITEIPYTITREAIIEKIIELNKEGKLKEVTNINDLTGLKGMTISVTARKNTNMEMLLEKLFKLTPLQSTFTVNMNLLVDGLPKVLGVWEIIDKWLEWRINCIKRGLLYDIQKMESDLHILRGLEKVLLNIDAAIEIIRKSPEKLIETRLMEKFDLDEVQAKNIGNMKLKNINKDYIIKEIKNIEGLDKKIKSYKKMINDNNKLNQIVINGLKDTIEKYGHDRKSQIIEKTEIKPIKIVEEIKNYPVIIYLTKDGYAYKFKNPHDPVLKPGDQILKVFNTNNKAEILIFSTDRICYKVKVNDIEETKPSALGTYLPTLTKDQNINIISYSVLDDEHKFLIAAYSNNRIAKINLKAFEGSRSILKNSFCLKQDLVDMVTLKDESKLKITTTKTEIIIDTKNFHLTNSRSATGVYSTRKGNLIKVEKIECAD
jgi:DNA gyrase subunit A